MKFLLLFLLVSTSAQAFEYDLRDRIGVIRPIGIDSLGTITMVSEHYGVTNYHVVEDTEYGKIVMNGELLLGEIVYIDKTYDLALIHIEEAQKFTNVCVKPLPMGAEVVAFGYALGVYAFHDGRQLALYEEGRFNTSGVRPGMSGGAVIDRDKGCVTGINKSTLMYPTAHHDEDIDNDIIGGKMSVSVPLFILQAFLKEGIRIHSAQS